ncbi:uncharacterized protein LOC127786907 isoform X2 [Diospyros lotus]|uniref:uncharacterized protein LOC127786907 isoform X2 n=1 Tax=Diospyros lotus TaxID=55363 RepID=UPI00224D3ED2|nr:uncharacterized protein LOC127786907 isoform X2 [Diospyros lotus]
MASTPTTKRSKPGLTNPNRKTKLTNNNHTPSSSSSSSHHSFLMEPPPGFLPSKSELFRLIAVVAIAASVAVACNYMATFLSRQPKPFCDSNADLDFAISESCQPCPSNAKCYDGKFECVHGYRKHGQLCIEDGDINKAAKKLSELVEIRACEAYAQFLCEGTGIVWIPGDKLWNELDGFKQMENHGLDTPVYDYAKQKAMETVGKSLEMRTNTLGIKELKCPDLLVEQYKPLTCYIRQWVAQHALVLVPFCALLIAGTRLSLIIRRRYYLSSRAEQLYNQVEELVQEDSRLDRYPKLVKGESRVVWEWQVEGSLSSQRKRKKGEERKLKLSEGINPSSSNQKLGIGG